ncbi:MAG: hypothetical protein LBI65_02190 [Candidatus Symbiothrix sp.]|jgi:hypothetical protein|nr:hypothetical protein [Candidatus Symbiothrix sp.]
METAHTEIIVVIPCYNEPDMMRTVESLFDCERGNFGVEIILVVNSYAISPEAVRETNRISFREAKRFASANNVPGFSLYPVLIEDLPGRQTGAGLPRKAGMDEAARKFRKNNLPQGIIVSLDADTTVEKNYLAEIYRCFKKDKLRSATIEFHHSVEHLDPEDAVRKAAEAYEKYLRDYRSALEYTGFPYPHYTIGSAFAVTEETYRKAGGMGKQQAGEDFYFLQKVFPLGKTRFIDTTCVYPAARISSRVPFGTGPAIAQMIEENCFVKPVYREGAFEGLKQLFDRIPSFYQSSAGQIDASIKDLPEHLRDFLAANGFLAKMEEINRHTATPENFRKRFFSYFSAFRIVKYLHAN